MPLRVVPCIFFSWLFSAACASNPDSAALALPGNNVYRNFPELNVPSAAEASDPIIERPYADDDSITFYRSKAIEYQQEVNRRGALIGNLNELSLVQLPVALTPPDGNTDYSVIISSIRITPAHAYLEAYFVFRIPQSGKKIAFRGTNIEFSYAGGLTGSGRLELLGDYDIDLHNKTLLTILGRGNTYVDFDCDGFKGMGLEASVAFSRDLIIPENDDGSLMPAPNRVETRVATYVQSWNDLMLAVNLPPFEINGLKGVGFSVSEAYLDWSDLANPPGLILPPDYASPYPEENPGLWRGFFLQRLDIRLPPQFSRKGDDSRITVGAENLIMDDGGLTGSLFAENILSTGDMSGWTYTIDKFQLAIEYNQIKGFEFDGRLTIPVVKNTEGTPAEFSYEAQKTADGNYQFAAKVDDHVKLPLWAADVSLYPGTSVVVKQVDKKFKPTATLNGELTIHLLDKAPKASINSIRFEGMIISSDAPHFTPGTFGLGSENQSSTAAGYPVVISNILVKSEDKSVGLGFDLAVNIGGKAEEEGFKGDGRLVVWGKEQPRLDEEGQQIPGSEDWKFDRVEIGALSVAIKKEKVVDLVGQINFFHDDPTYGEGFNGSLKGKICMVAVHAEALFGKTPDFRYWFADALAEWKRGIPLMPGLSAYGFGGGFFSNMKQTDQNLETAVGKTSSGERYVPDSQSMGVRAMVEVGAPTPSAFNGDVLLDLELNKHGGINAVTLVGNASFMSPMKGVIEKAKKHIPLNVKDPLKVQEAIGNLEGQVNGRVVLHYDHVNDIFHGNIEIYINVIGGVMKGVGDRGRAGWATIHFEPGTWYILIGTPNDPVGLEVARLFKASGYFMLGKDLPGSPPPPEQVSEILGNVDLDYMRDFNALQSGTGFAFGLHFLVDTGELHFLMFYARFSAGTGLDIMLKDYGNAYHCAGSSGPMGIDGWYANGQAYAFVQGKIGIHVKLSFFHGDYEILGIGAAAVLQAKGPNPFWMQGTVGGYYSILGGMVKGHCRFKVTVGKECKPEGEENVLAGLKMIAEMAPEQNAKQVDVFTSPQVAFNIPIGEEFHITDMDNETHTFKAVLDAFNVSDNSQSLTGKQKWNSTNDVVAFESGDLLPGSKRLKATARLAFEEKVDGVWQKVHYQGRDVVENSETSFETGQAPDFIPPDNVAYSYPLYSQRSFLTDEAPAGFITLKRGQPYLFQSNPDWTPVVRFSDETGGAPHDAALYYNESKKQARFDLPDGLKASTTYRLQVLRLPMRQAVDYNISEATSSLTAGGEDTLTTKTIAGNRMNAGPELLYEMPFHTSRYSTFQSKMKAINMSPGIRVQESDVDVFVLTSYFRGEEAFEPSEFIGTATSLPLLHLQAVLKGNRWYDKEVYPLVYDGYPLMGSMRLRNRDPEVDGLPPVYQMRFDDVYPDHTGDLSPRPFVYERVTYSVAEDVITDFKDLRNQAANYLIDYPGLATSRLKRFLVDPAPWLSSGKYKVILRYEIPGAGTSSNYTIQLQNPVRINR